MLSPSLKDLVTILYRPRETMRRILDSGPDRWALQVVILAAVCTSVSDSDIHEIGDVLPGIRMMPLMAAIALAIIANAVSWVVTWYVLSWIAGGIGKLLAGTATMSDVRAAFGWALVPAIWSPMFRVPFAIYATRLSAGASKNVEKLLIGFLSHGGCSVIVVYLALLFASEIGCLVLASFTLAEAERFSTQKGFVNVASTLALPVLIVLASVFAFRS